MRATPSSKMTASYVAFWSFTNRKSRSTVEGYARFSPANSKWTKHTVAEHVSLGGNGPLLVGTPSQVADGLETWVKEADVDGFNLVSRHLFNSKKNNLI